MNYLSKPITGLITKTSQLFSGRVKTLINFCVSVTEYRISCHLFREHSDSGSQIPTRQTVKKLSTINKSIRIN